MSPDAMQKDVNNKKAKPAVMTGFFISPAVVMRCGGATHTQNGIGGVAMQNKRYYVNSQTGEITENKTFAMWWYRAGFTVECWKNGKNYVTLVM